MVLPYLVSFPNHLMRVVRIYGVSTEKHGKAGIYDVTPKDLFRYRRLRLVFPKRYSSDLANLKLLVRDRVVEVSERLFLVQISDPNVRVSFSSPVTRG